MDAATQTANEDRRYMSRKFRFSVAAWLAGTAAYAAGFFMETPMMTTDQWILFTQWIVGLYLVGNVSDTLVTGLANVFTVRQ
jgi:hypothetical protein